MAVKIAQKKFESYKYHIWPSVQRSQLKIFKTTENFAGRRNLPKIKNTSVRPGVKHQWTKSVQSYYL